MRREVGPLLLAWHFITALDLVGTVDRALPQRGRQQLSVGEAVAALVCSRLCSPSPLYNIAGWASGAALQELLGIPAALLNDDRLGRALEILAVYSETLRGTLAARAIERFGVVQASTATRRLGRTARSPSLKWRANSSLAFNSSSATDKGTLLGAGRWSFVLVVGRRNELTTNDHRLTTFQFTLYNRRVNLGLNLEDTIVAIATPAGRGGIGVVRVAGPRALEIARPILRLKHELEPGHAVFGELIEPCSAGAPAREVAEATAFILVSGKRARAPAPHEERIDEVVVNYFARPHS